MNGPRYPMTPAGTSDSCLENTPGSTAIRMA
jgi:hypothetical protein